MADNLASNLTPDDPWHTGTGYLQSNDIGYEPPHVMGKPGNRLIKIDPSELTQYVLLDGDFEIEQHGNTIVIKAFGPSFYDRCMKGN